VTAALSPARATATRASTQPPAQTQELLADVDVLCMTPDVLLHTLSHGVFKVRPRWCVLCVVA
jgi:hypothetical protein